MKLTLTTSSFLYEERSNGKAGTHKGGGRRDDANGDGASTASVKEED